MAFQDLIPDNWCWGCGSLNESGLQLKSEWDGEAAVAAWTPRPEHAAGPPHVLNGGIIATVLDCHGICTAVADAYRVEGREIGIPPDIWYATASLKVAYLRPTPIEATVHLRADVARRDGRRTVVECSLAADGKERARAVVEAVRVPAEWKHGGARPPGRP